MFEYRWKFFVCAMSEMSMLYDCRTFVDPACDILICLPSVFLQGRSESQCDGLFQDFSTRHTRNNSVSSTVCVSCIQQCCDVQYDFKQVARL